MRPSVVCKRVSASAKLVLIIPINPSGEIDFAHGKWNDFRMLTNSGAEIIDHWQEHAWQPVSTYSPRNNLSSRLRIVIVSSSVGCGKSLPYGQPSSIIAVSC